MSGPKCTLPPEKHAEILARFDIYLSEDEDNEIRAMFPQYLFFRNEFQDPDNDRESENTPVRWCTCTACGESFPAIRGNYPRGKLHGEKCNCPQCGAEVEGRAVMKYKYDMPSLTNYIHVAVLRVEESGALLIQAGIAIRRFTHDELGGELSFHEMKRYYIAPGDAQCWKAQVDYDNCAGWSLPWYEMPKTWAPTKTVSDCFQRNMNSYWGDYQAVGLARALERREWKYCQIADFYHYRYAANITEPGGSARWVVPYLAWYALHPQIEMAVKLGYSDAVEELIESGKKNAKFLNWNAKRPGEFLRLRADEAKRATTAGLGLQGLREWKEVGGGIGLTQYLDIRERVGTENLKLLASCADAAGCTLAEAMRYAEKQTPACARMAPPLRVILQTWRDYLDMARRQGYDLDDRTAAMPRELRERHDRAAELDKLEGKKNEARRYARRRRMLEKTYGFALGELRVVIPTGSEEIVREGRTLKHCVGGYAARHIEGKTTILFIRKRRTPGRSFLTVELNEDKRRHVTIRQIHGYKNEGYARRSGERENVRPELRYAWFLDTWLGWVNSGSPRDRDGQPVLPEKKIDGKEKTA